MNHGQSVSCPIPLSAKDFQDGVLLARVDKGQQREQKILETGQARPEKEGLGVLEPERLGQEKQHPPVGLLWEVGGCRVEREWGSTGRDRSAAQRREQAPGAGGSLQPQLEATKVETS